MQWGKQGIAIRGKLESAGVANETWDFFRLSSNLSLPMQIFDKIFDSPPPPLLLLVL